MTLPPAFRFPRAGFWAAHALLVPAVLGGGIALGTFHATGHGEADAHAAHLAEPSPAPAPGAPSTDPLRAEMVALQAAYDRLNRAVVLGEADGVAAAFHAVHLRKEATAAAIAAGTLRPPKNPDRLEAFVARDEAFHAVLGQVVAAADRGDVDGLRALLPAVQAACVDCHAEFRPPGGSGR